MGAYDVIVVGAGHAGCEAGLASARLGLRTLVLSVNLDGIALMACNPSIGGSGKGHLVREIDALGGQMGLTTDETFLQSKTLNTAKGPAVHSLRAQADKVRYHEAMKRMLERQENLDLKQGEAVEILTQDGHVTGVVLRTGAVYDAKAVILATGTFLGGRIFIGGMTYEGGPSGLQAATMLGENLRTLGLPIRRFKTGTPPRAYGSSLDYAKMTEQKGDDVIEPFSLLNDSLDRDQVSCWLTYTNEETHKIIRENVEKSALYGGAIRTAGPRYCPSIEDKVMRFADRERHQIFVEPESLTTDEVYIQGMSTTLPENLQCEFLRTVPGFEHAKFARPAYAIEYDCIDPTDLEPTLESRTIRGLYGAGQFNGSSGYEEAAAQGLVAGINAALKLQGKPPFTLDRSESYIGVLIDDMVTKGITEPYRIMTSRAEYRLLLRNDNADERLTPKAYATGLASEERYRKYLATKEAADREIERLRTTWLSPEETTRFLVPLGDEPVTDRSLSLADLLRRPEVTYEALAEAFPPEEGSVLSRRAAAKVSAEIKYEGYIEKQKAQVEKFKRLENRKIPEGFVFEGLSGLRIEAVQRLVKARPDSIGRASRLPGVSPADVAVLLVHVEKFEREQREKRAENIKTEENKRPGKPETDQ